MDKFLIYPSLYNLLKEGNGNLSPVDDICRAMFLFLRVPLTMVSYHRLLLAFIIFMLLFIKPIFSILVVTQIPLLGCVVFCCSFNCSCKNITSVYLIWELLFSGNIIQLV